jgi:hypothetical protein
MDWFQVLAGFREESYSTAQAQLKISDGRSKSLVNGRSYEIGELELVSLHELRRRAISANAALGRFPKAALRLPNSRERSSKSHRSSMRVFLSPVDPTRV